MMTDEEKLKMEQFFTWELMRLGVLSDDARTGYDVIQTTRHREKWLVAQARYEEAEEIQQMISALFADKSD